MLLLLLSAAIAQGGAAPAWDQVYEKAKPSIPILINHGGGDCSGVLVEPSYVLTADHCVANLRGVSLVWADAPRAYEEAEVVWLDRKHDLALLKLARPSTRRPVQIVDASYKVREGMPVATIGHPTSWEPFKSPPVDLDSTYLISAGIVSKVTEDDLLLDLSISPGNSGGPVLDADGRLVGLVSRKRVGFAVGQIGYVTAPGRIREALEKMRQKGEASYSLFSAQSTFGAEISLSYHSFLEDVRYSSDGEQWQWGLSYNLWDRVALYYRSGFGIGSDRWFYAYGAGYRFLVSLGNRTSIRITPAYERAAYRFRVGAGGRGVADGHGGSLTVGHPAIPLSFRVSVLRVRDETQTAIGLVMGDVL